MTAYVVGPRGESNPVTDHSADPLTPEVRNVRRQG